MDYDEKIWNDYTDENEKSDENPSSFIYHVALALDAKNVLEAGCNVGNNLKDFPKDFHVEGFDMNTYALEKCKKRYPEFKFNQGTITKIPYADSSFDLVFTRTVLIHIPPSEMKQATNELFRVSRKWILNIEFFGENEDMVNWKRGKDLLWQRNMKKRWSEYKVRVLSDVEIPLEMDPNKVRFTLVEKL